MPAEAASSPRSHVVPGIQFALVLAILAGLAWHARPDGRLHLFFPALQGDAVIIQLPSGAIVLVDGGGAPAALSAALGRRMPFWQRRIQAVVVTDADSNHLPGQVDALAHYHAEAAYSSAAVLKTRSAMAREWQRLLREQATPLHVLQTGQHIELGDGVSMRVLASDSTVLQIGYGRTSVLLAQGPFSGTDGQARLHPPVRSPDLAVIAWQSDPHSSPLVVYQPAAVLYSDGLQAEQPPQLSYAERRVGEERQYHERIDGALEWISDGRHSSVLTENGQP